MVCPFFGTFVSSSALSRGPRQPPLTQLIAVLVFGFWVTYLRPKLNAHGILSVAGLARARLGAWVKTAGVVIVRQRPGTAKGFLFITLEDETGISNLIVTPDLFQKHRLLLRRASVLLAEGVFQKVDGVMAIHARRFAELKIDATLPPSHNFH